MNATLNVSNTFTFMNVEVPQIEGGFGEGKKAILAKTIAELHDRELKHINQLINSNRARFKDGVDLIDLKNSAIQSDPLLTHGLYSKQAYANSSNIYLLSERGYSKLIKIMDDDLSWEVHDKLVDEYFSMRELINDPVKLYMSMSEEDRAIAYFQNLKEQRQLQAHAAQLEAQQETNKPKVEGFNAFLNADGLFTFELFAKTLGVQKTKMLAWMRAMKVLQDKQSDTNIHNVPYAEFMQTGKRPAFEVKTEIKGGFIHHKVLITPKGAEWLRRNFIQHGFIK